MAEREKLLNFVDNPASLIEFAVKEYSKKEGFEQKYNGICREYEHKMEEVLKGNVEWIEY